MEKGKCLVGTRMAGEGSQMSSLENLRADSIRDKQAVRGTLTWVKLLILGFLTNDSISQAMAVMKLVEGRMGSGSEPVSYETYWHDSIRFDIAGT